MSLFVATLAYGEGSAELAIAKFAILVASVIAGVGGYLILRSVDPAPVAEHPPPRMPG